MRFLDGKSFAEKMDYTLLCPSLLFSRKHGEMPLGGAPWIPYSQEEAQTDIFGRKYYWDLNESKFQFIEVETEDENANPKQLVSQA
jgi:hypothetical protein